MNELYALYLNGIDTEYHQNEHHIWLIFFSSTLLYPTNHAFKKYNTYHPRYQFICSPIIKNNIFSKRALKSSQLNMILKDPTSRYNPQQSKSLHRIKLKQPISYPLIYNSFISCNQKPGKEMLGGGRRLIHFS